MGAENPPLFSKRVPKNVKLKSYCFIFEMPPEKLEKNLVLTVNPRIQRVNLIFFEIIRQFFGGGKKFSQTPDKKF